ncbi:unnamed protein product [Somion occarium]|uniref:SCP domain-containing protein n=1 Tax=Somion occarium TaxID=3059160 RepID=A0ABP1CMU9_9APHY
MARLTCTALFYVVIFAFTSSVLAGPGCARRLQGQDTCLTQCDKNWGWPGKRMGTDRWGNVVEATVTDMATGSIVTKQCRLRPESVSSAVPSETAPVANVASEVSLISTTSLTSTLVSVNQTAAPTSNNSVIPTNTSSKSSSASSKLSTSSQTTTRSSTRASQLSPSSSSLPPPAPTTSTATPSPETTTAPPPSPSPSPESSSKEPAKPAATTANASVQNVATGGGSSSASDSDIQQYLSAHNSVRAQHGASPLTWSDDAAAKAQTWANGCVFEHSGGSLGPLGENLSAGTAASFGISEAIKTWTDEVSEYDPNNPQPSHFTQVVWKATTQVGCAVQSCDGIFASSFGKAKFFVCEYSPQGNFIGAFAQNVQV